MKRTLSEAARVVGGELIGEDRPYGCVCTDSRTLKPGALFVALRGPNFDGAAFVQAAAAQGAIGALVERATPGALPQVLGGVAVMFLLMYLQKRLGFGDPFKPGAGPSHPIGSKCNRSTAERSSARWPISVATRSRWSRISPT